MTKAPHDMELFEQLRTQASSIHPASRTGRMFGCPAIYVGRKMAACVLHNEVGLRVPAQVADAARSSGRARPFTPYGKNPMREWIALDLPADHLHLAQDLLEAAMRFASENDAKT